jgi:SAM-dependent methyltransferase
MKWFVDNYINKLSGTKKLKVLDVGSYDVNGSYRHLFPEDFFKYIGLDMEAGPNVDLVPNNSYKWDELDTDSFDIVISGQAFEHIEFFWITMAEMTRVLKKDGLICIIAPNLLGEHRYPVDCYRFFTDGMVALARYVSLDPMHAHTNLVPGRDHKQWYNEFCTDSMLVAKKGYSGNAKFVNLEKYECVPSIHAELNSNFVTPSKKSLLNRGFRKIEIIFKNMLNLKANN